MLRLCYAQNESNRAEGGSRCRSFMRFLMKTACFLRNAILITPLEIRCSIQLSYGGNGFSCICLRIES